MNFNPRLFDGTRAQFTALECRIPGKIKAGRGSAPLLSISHPHFFILPRLDKSAS